MKIAVFCEAESDFVTATALADRILREEGPAWLADLHEADPSAVREWVPDTRGQAFFNLHYYGHYASEIELRPQASFDGKRRAAGALMLRTILRIVRASRQGIARRRGAREIDAVIVVWDMDDEGSVRREALHRTREEERALHEGTFEVVLGCPDPMREAWVLAGFEPQGAEERAMLTSHRRELGFSPCDEAHRLDAKKETAKHSAKRVLEELTRGDRERAARCCIDTPLAVLRARGGHSGLRDFLDEVKDILLPRFGRR